MIRRGPMIVLLAAALTAGCTAYSLVPPERQTIDGAFTVEPQVAWSRKVNYSGNVDTWTIDGAVLEQVSFVTGLSDGDKAVDKDDAPKYRKGMSPLDLQEFLIGTMKALGTGTVQVGSFRPVRIGTVEAFRLEATYTPEDGLRRDGIFVAFTLKDKLYAILYAGARGYYFDRTKPAFENMLASVKPV